MYNIRLPVATREAIAHRAGAKQLPEPRIGYCQNPDKQISVIFNEIQYFSSKKMYL